MSNSRALRAFDMAIHTSPKGWYFFNPPVEVILTMNAKSEVA